MDKQALISELVKGIPAPKPSKLSRKEWGYILLAERIGLIGRREW